ncbi:Asp23/Gls24 family envelope stress response protein [Oceanotoga sp. DSM 15011]|uniref:Alkaline shock family protein YloU n=1 Tax=Oceanotoga teriensis TaxID=515440 RepID=A0AA45HIZ4_9BACT|nr:MULTISPECIES: Asp23/Gls24 family envelope stress response protein [Oceanotoga]MDN5341844.1 hypothetical protein [Oceanotoga sp.]MDO7976675.1 Asp23/Gls24 family envelope stress response protein [Oceanotoga teriensis]PWJ95196.1 putative alkaline shock family protein YloU [Oceanotoga teriensis]UYP00677.1 Asp23/Gls24 family envelope stress response protein [Oceanotoga sp. DSM 15011]
MPIKEDNNFGEITISENVLRDITYKTIENFLMEEKIYTNKVQKELMKNIKIANNDDGSLSVFLRIPAKYGENIVEFSKKAQKIIKEELEKMSEIFITNVDISIENLEYPMTEENESEEVVEENKEKWDE